MIVSTDNQEVDIHVQKVRKKRVGLVGMVTLRYDRVTGRYHDLIAGRDESGRTC